MLKTILEVRGDGEIGDPTPGIVEEPGAWVPTSTPIQVIVPRVRGHITVTADEKPARLRVSHVSIVDETRVAVTTTLSLRSVSYA